MSSLRAWRRKGEYVYIRIGQADDFFATLSELKARVPATARRYLPDEHEWRVDRAYENVLADLFANYAAISSPNPLTRAMARREARYGSPAQHRLPSWWSVWLLLGLAVTVSFVVFVWQPFAPSSNPQAVPGQATAVPGAASSAVTPMASPTASTTTDTLRPQQSSASGNRLMPARVVSVVDGDTIEVSLDGQRYRLRYIGMDTPERGESFYRESTARNRDLVARQTVYLEKDVSETDRFGRLLRYVYLADGRMVNEVLVADGFASAATFPPDVKYVARLQAAERAAQQAGLGLWGD